MATLLDLECSVCCVGVMYSESQPNFENLSSTAYNVHQNNQRDPGCNLNSFPTVLKLNFYLCFLCFFLINV